MPHNLTNLVQTKVLPGLYQQYVWGSQTSWMDANAAQLDGTYKGGKYMYFRSMTVQGMANYDRNLGYVTGYADAEKKQYEMTQDRGRKFVIDFIDNDETGFILSVANVLSAYNRDWVIPEIDSYRISKIYSTVLAEKPAAVSDANISKAVITQTLADDLTALQDVYGTGIRFAIMMSATTQAYFGQEWIHNLDYVTVNNGMANLKLRGIDGNPFFIMPSSRLKTAYTFYDGTSVGQTAGGFAVAGGAKDIKWLITPMSAPIAVMKQDKVRVFSPDENQTLNAWSVDHRIYHDLWMLPNGYNASFIRTGAFVA